MERCRVLSESLSPFDALEIEALALNNSVFPCKLLAHHVHTCAHIHLVPTHIHNTCSQHTHIKVILGLLTFKSNIYMQHKIHAYNAIPYVILCHCDIVISIMCIKLNDTTCT